MPSYSNVFVAIGTIAIPFVIFHWRRSLLLLIATLLLSGCGENDAPHSHTDTIPVATPTPSAMPTAVDTASVDSISATTASPTTHKTDTSSAKEKASPKKADTTSAGTRIAAKDETQVKPDTKPKADQKEKGEKSTGSGGCAEITPDLIKQGKMIFTGQGNCTSCHGIDAKGNVLGPDLTDAKWLHISGDYPSIVKIVRTGVNLVVEYRSPMPPMGGAKLSDDELCAVGAYIWSLSH